jgi:hypothetical protein
MWERAQPRGRAILLRVRSAPSRVAAFQLNWQRGHTEVWWTPRCFPPLSQVPRDFDFGDAGLLLRSTKLDGSGEVATFRRGRLGRKNGYLCFFSSTFWLPSAGRWLVV